ncbi:MAG TPA: thioesterase family protein [Mycobacteriales bacterium]|nr:thioesterase family protein [Mycobacteriales bacterium]
MTKFAADTAVTPLGGGAYDTAVSPDWWVYTGPNGGYIASLVLRAMTAEVDDPGRAARSLTVHYLRPAASAPARVTTRVVRAGRSVTTLAADLYQEDTHVATALAAFARPREGTPSFHDATPPYPAGPDETPPSAWPDHLRPPIARQFEYRPLTTERLFEGAERAEAAAWLRLADPEPYDPVLLATVSDAVVPAVFAKATTPLAAVTVDLTVHFRGPATAPPGDGWCLAAFRSTVAADGYVEEDGEMYAADGTLLAQSRQLAVLVPMS